MLKLGLGIHLGLLLVVVELSYSHLCGVPGDEHCQQRLLKMLKKFDGVTKLIVGRLAK